MKEIGGYFELELQPSKNKLFKSNAVYVNSGRNAFEYIIRSIPKVNKVWMPYYTCSSLQEPISRLNLEIEYYHINAQLEIDNIDSIHLGINDYLLYTNYFGVKGDYADFLQQKFQDNLILDNSQALFYTPSNFCFYSPRKFVGLPDGGVAYSKYKYALEDKDTLSYDRCSHLLKRFDLKASEGYGDFKENGAKISGLELKEMSSLTYSLIQSIDFEPIKQKRTANFKYLHKYLGEYNELSIIINNIDGPLVYPFLCQSESLRSKLIQNKIYVATYWPNVLSVMKEDSVEYQLAKNVVPLSIDQRYNEKELEEIIKVFKYGKR